MANRTDRRKNKTRILVLEKALGLFAQKGTEEVSMAEIADAADLSRGTLYNLFENRDALLSEAVLPAMESITAACRSLAEGATVEPAEAFRILLDAWRDYRPALALMTILRAPLPPSLERGHRELIRAYTEVFKKVVAVGRPLLLSKPESLAYLVFRISVPLLEAMEEEGVPDNRFLPAMEGLLSRS